MTRSVFYFLICFAITSIAIGNNTYAFEKGKECGGISGITCNKGLMCEYPVGTCGVADIMGKCIEKPEVCQKDYRPVCGCDKRTYSNDCQRQAAGVSKAYDGNCGAKTMMKK